MTTKPDPPQPPQQQLPVVNGENPPPPGNIACPLQQPWCAPVQLSFPMKLPAAIGAPLEADTPYPSVLQY